MLASLTPIFYFILFIFYVGIKQASEDGEFLHTQENTTRTGVCKRPAQPSPAHSTCPVAHPVLATSRPVAAPPRSTVLLVLLLLARTSLDARQASVPNSTPSEPVEWDFHPLDPGGRSCTSPHHLGGGGAERALHPFLNKARATPCFLSFFLLVDFASYRIAHGRYRRYLHGEKGRRDNKGRKPQARN